MISFLVGIAVILLTFYIGMIYESVAIGLLGFAEAVFLVAALLFLLWQRRRIAAAIQIPTSVTEQGESVTVRLGVANRGRIPCGKIRYRIGCTALGKMRGEWLCGSPVQPGKNRYEARLPLPVAGNYAIELRQIRIYDMTGLFYIGKKIGRGASVQVLPQIEAAPVKITERTRHFFGDADIYDDFRPGNDKSELFGIREFRDGDKIQSIHWKLSAKSDELLVRENSQPLACPVVLILSDIAKINRKNQGAYLSVAASIVFSIMDAGCPHFVSWYSRSEQDMVRVRVDDEEGYYLFWSLYLQDCGSPAGATPEELYAQKYRSDRPLHTLALTPSLTLTRNGGPAAAYSARDWKRDVAGMELML
ncbi:MAG: DUF58 domain-containing protein [Clostridiales bacterium]|nr:DUF58 domain-containing protein [Clostridiales bacterium]